MTSAGITARNRANAAKSTGPRTAAGKAASAQNARRHGATGRPDPESVATWLRVILDAPDLDPGDLLADDARHLSALALARAEVRLASAAHALQEHEAEAGAWRKTETVLLREIRLITGLIESDPLSEVERVKDLLLRLRMRKYGVKAWEKEGRLLRRYWREARAQRRRAFAEWVALLQAEAGDNARTGRIPKRSQISTGG